MIALAALLVAAQPFHVVVLGAQGGLEDGDLSAYVAGVAGKKAVLLDAGTLVHGVEVARARGTLGCAGKRPCTVARILKERVGAALISHPHYDHVMGLVIGSPDDAPRSLLGLPSTIDALRDHVFNGLTWANFGDDGNAPALKRYRYVRMAPGTPVHLDDEGVDVTAYPLSHGGITSTAFVVDAGDSAVVYCGDTGADVLEHGTRLAELFAHVAGLVRGHKLAALFLEASYPSARDDKLLFGHLTPRLLLEELRVLARDVDLQHPNRALAGVNVVVTHMKPTLDGTSPRAEIVEELRRGNDLGVRFRFPSQGDALELAPP